MRERQTNERDKIEACREMNKCSEAKGCLEGIGCVCMCLR